MPKFERKVEIDAPVEKVWEVMTDPDLWPEWFPGMETVFNVTSMSENGQFEWTNEGQQGKGVIVKIEPNKRLEIITQVDDDKDSHTFTLKSAGGFLGLGADECAIEYELDTLTGRGILTNFIEGGNPNDAIKVKKAMHKLRRLVESK